jgi:hypothetical protein
MFFFFNDIVGVQYVSTSCILALECEGKAQISRHESRLNEVYDCKGFQKYNVISLHIWAVTVCRFIQGKELSIKLQITLCSYI